MAFINKSFLKERSKFYYFQENFIVGSKEEAQITIFLSHCHIDKELAEGFKSILASYNIYVYIDWEDSTLPSIPNRETANKIKQKIKELDLFILLATDNALSSKWCPWELGIADSLKGYESILIVPIVDDNGEFKGNEYLQLYKRIEISLDKNIFVLDPVFKKYGEKLFAYSPDFKSMLLGEYLKTKG